MFGLQCFRTSHLITSKLCTVNQIKKNDFWAWLNFIFNRVSQSRVNQVGPDRACAEWLMRNGAFVRWKGQGRFVSHYDQLPKDEDKGLYYIQDVDATNASISHQGFPHFKNCKHIESLKFDRCDYLEDKALFQLDLIKDSLESLFICQCGNLTDNGIMAIKKLLNLRSLEIKNLIQVNDVGKCVKELQNALPNCKITYLAPE